MCFLIFKLAFILLSVLVIGLEVTDDYEVLVVQVRVSMYISRSFDFFE